MDQVHKPAFITDVLVRMLDRHADRVVLQLPDGATLTGAAMADETSRFQQAMEAQGIDRTARVAILSTNRAEVLHVTHAGMLIASLVTPLHPLGSVEDFLYVVEDAGIDTVIFDPKFDALIAQVRSRAPQVRRFLSLGESPHGDDLVRLAGAQAPARLIAPDLTGDEVYRLTYSGGTTGKPKAIPSTIAGASVAFQLIASEWEWPGEVRQLLCAPLSHTGGVMFLPTLMHGGTLYVIPGFEPLKVLEAIETHRITCLLLVPTMIYALLDHPRFGEFDLSSLETVMYGASPMSAARLREGIEKLGPVFFQFYGQVEAPMTITVLRRAEHDVDDPRRLASCGRPVPWVQVALLDSEGREVPDGEPGEICVRGPLVMPGYLNRPELNAEVFRHGWLHTGDVAVRDPGDFLRIVDRSKDMIITGGFNVYPREVEDAIDTHPAVAASSVFGVKDEHWGEMVTAAVVLRHDADVSAQELSALVKSRKGAHQAPKRIEFLDALPLTALGKPDKNALRARFGP